MATIDLHPITLLINILKIITWAFPLFLLTILSYYLEKYTKFKTQWKLLVGATLISLLPPLMEYELLGNTVLLASMGLGAYASLKLLRFQNTRLGKTRDAVDILVTIGVVVPILALIDARIQLPDTLSLMANNLSTTLLVLIFLITGKTLRNYIPRHGNTVYTIVILAALLLPITLAVKDYVCIVNPSECAKSPLLLFGIMVQSIGSILLALGVFILIREAKIRGIHLTPAEKKEVPDSPLKYRLKKGYSYIIHETNGKKGFEIFSEYINHKHHGFGIIRTKPDRVREEYGLRTTPMLWMTTAETEQKSVKPQDLERLLLIMKDFIKTESKSILLVERLDYLISENGFNKTLTFVHRLNDLIVSSDCVLVVSMSLNTLAQEQRSQLMAELKDLSDSDKIVLNESLYQLLEFIYNENESGKRPSFKKITDTFQITKTTTRKRIYELIDKHLIKIIEDGKFKLLEVTEEGKNIMKSPVGPKGW